MNINPQTPGTSRPPTPIPTNYFQSHTSPSVLYYSPEQLALIENQTRQINRAGDLYVPTGNTPNINNSSRISRHSENEIGRIMRRENLLRRTIASSSNGVQQSGNTNGDYKVVNLKKKRICALY